MINISTIKDKWHARGFDCNLWTDPPQQVWENFSHATDELFMLLEGKIELEIAGKIKYPTIGEEVLIPAQAIHSVRNKGKSGSRWLYGYKQ
jgi:mannose-6-phosphate isomerase-like protein (cupin superfamily)